MELNPHVGSGHAEELRAREAADREAADRKALEDQTDAAKRKDADTRAADHRADDNNRAAARRADLLKDDLDRKAADRRADYRRFDAQRAEGSDRSQGRDDEDARRRVDPRSEGEQSVGALAGENRPSSLNASLIEGRAAEDRPIMRPDQDKPLWAPAIRGSEESGPGTEEVIALPDKSAPAADQALPSYVQRARDRNAGFVAANEAAGLTAPNARTIEQANQHAAALERTINHRKSQSETRQSEPESAEQPGRRR